MLAGTLFGSAGCLRNRAAEEKRSYTRLELAKDFLSKGELASAEREAQKALGYHARNEEAHNLLGILDLLRGQRAVSLIEIEGCLTGLDADVMRAELDDHLVAADAHFAKAGSLASDYGEPWANRGVVALQLEQHERAIQMFEKALELPYRLQDIAVVRANLGWAYFRAGDHVQAAKELLQANQFRPGRCLTSYRLGRVYFARKEWEKAREQFQEVTSDNCPIQDAQLYLMKTDLELGMSERLADTERACVEMAPRSCVAAKCRSLVSVAMGSE